ncbi:MAG TPA: Fic family protein [Longimicrobium sp.]|nr:Fic family protein [Longimicrobium sp.]
MPRLTRDKNDRQRARLLRIIGGFPDGIGREKLAREYEGRFGTRIAWRTLLRRLHDLADAGKITAVGVARNRVYRPAAVQVPVPGVARDDGRPADLATEEDYVPLSPAGAEVRALIRRPISQREPVGYRMEFLERYRPGTTWYLPKDVRGHLHEIGVTADPERPAGTFARDVFDRLLIDLSWASSRLEGNTYSRLDTQNLIQFGQQAEGKDGQQAQMILNHKRAIEFLVDEAEVVGLDRRTLTTIHSALSENLLDDPRDEGGIRKRPVGISGTPYLPVAIPQVVEDALDLLLASASAIPDPFEQAFFAMVHIPYLQPFTDVNKRTSRLAANIPLIRANLCPLSFVDVPERAYVEGTLGVYEQTRVELLRDVFVWAYERSCAQYRVVRESMGQPDPLRLRYRDALAEVVRHTIVSLAPPGTRLLRAWAQEHGVPDDDREGFVDRALSLLMGLHEGNIGRYRIRPAELDAWNAEYRS